jgi:hypothetical protein
MNMDDMNLEIFEELAPNWKSLYQCLQERKTALEADQKALADEILNSDMNIFEKWTLFMNCGYRNESPRIMHSNYNDVDYFGYESFTYWEKGEVLDLNRVSISDMAYDISKRFPGLRGELETSPVLLEYIEELIQEDGEYAPFVDHFETPEEILKALVFYCQDILRQGYTHVTFDW